MTVTYPLRIIFDCSTAHLSAATHQWLDAYSVQAATRQFAAINAPSATPFGWFVYVAELPYHHGEPADLVAVMRHARATGAEFVLFDADAPPDPTLPLFPSLA